MAWLLLLVAGLLEIVMALALKLSAGWTRPWPGALGMGAGIASIFVLTHAVKSLPTGTAYAVWTGIGGVGVAAAGIIWFGESQAPGRLASIGLVVAGLVGLHLADA